ncbi:MAG: monovalent cation/H+ antiporter complex subunit F [Spirochaeta sp.]
MIPLLRIFLYILYLLIALASFRLIIGPSIYDRLMALSMISALVVVLMCIYAVIYQRDYYLDVAMVYALLSFAEILAVTRFQTRRRRPSSL